MEILDFKEVLVRKPWYRVSPTFSEKQKEVRNRLGVTSPTDYIAWDIYTQEDMLREYFPTGHKIFNKEIYPDILKKDPENGRYHLQPITRCSIAMQMILATKHIIHLCGNDVQFELASSKVKRISKNNDTTNEDKDNDTLTTFRQGWINKDIEIRMYESIRSLKITAEACIVGWIDKGKFGCKTLSFMNGDVLFPHFNSMTGELELFARKFYDYDEDGIQVTEWVEVWDDENYYIAKRDVEQSNAIDKVIKKIKGIFGIDGYVIKEKKKHGFNFVPVAYYREEEGPCWNSAQNTIEHYEEAISYFFENNKAFAFPILVVSGEGVELNGDEITGAVKSISIESNDGKAQFLEGNDVSSSYKALLDLMYKTIYEQAFAVKPPELKSGDLPGVALKLLYSPAIERAIDDAQRLQPFLTNVVKMVKYGYGLEINQQATLMALDINAWIEPYVHQNDSELVTNLTTAVQNKVLSMQTASERLSKYSKNDEYDRIMREMKEKQKLEIEKEEIVKTHDTDEEIRKSKSISSGSDINTGGGEGSGRIRQTDKWGNHEGENNWSDWNDTH